MSQVRPWCPSLVVVVGALLLGGCGSAPSSPSSDGFSGGSGGAGGGSDVGSGGEQPSGGGASSTGGDPSGLGGAGGSGLSGAGGASSGGATPGGGGATPGGGGTIAGGGGATGGGAGSDGAGGASEPFPDLAGTWITQVKTDGKMTVPVAGETDVHIDLVTRLFLTNEGGVRTFRFDICRLGTVTYPNANQLRVVFTPAAVATMTTSVTGEAVPVAIGDSVPLPNLGIFTGEEPSEAAVDSDHDGHPGITIPASLIQVFSANAYAGLELRVLLAAKLADASTVKGSASFSAIGQVFGSDNLLLTSGSLSVITNEVDVPFVAARLEGDVSCADVLERFPPG